MARVDKPAGEVETARLPGLLAFDVVPEGRQEGGNTGEDALAVAKKVTADVDKGSRAASTAR